MSPEPVSGATYLTWHLLWSPPSSLPSPCRPQQDIEAPEVSHSVPPGPHALLDSFLVLLGIWHQCNGDSGQVL